MLIFFIVIISLSILILGHELGHFIAAKKLGMRVDEFGFGFPPRIWAWRPRKKEEKGRRKEEGADDTSYSINALPFGGFVRIAGESDRVADGVPKLESLSPAEKARLFYFQPAWKKAAVVGAGVAVNFLLGWFLLSAVLVAGSPEALIISGVQPNSPAEAAGLREGDVVLGFAGAREFTEFAKRNAGKEVLITAKRNGGEFAVSAVPRADVGEGEGALGVYLVEAGEEGRGIFAALWEGLKRSLYVSGAIAAVFFALVKNLFAEGSLLEGVVGPVGVFSIAQTTGSIGLTYLVQMVSLISLNLAVINLIPFPALDGGRLVLIVIEKIKKAPIPRRIEIYANALGFAFLMSLMAALTVRDIAGLL